MFQRLFGWRSLAAIGIAATIGIGADNGANAAGGNGDSRRHRVYLSDRPKTIVIDNLDTATLDRGDPALAQLTQEVCGDCHSTDYPATQPRLTCGQWASGIVRMGNTFRAAIPWQEDGIGYATLNLILGYLASNYGQGAGSCDTNAVRAIPGLVE
jgi:hypothetical protein